MKYTPDFLDSVETFAKDELLNFMLLTCEDKEIPLFVSKAILEAIKNAKTV